MPRALHVPADFRQPVKIVEIGSGGGFAKLVGGFPTRASYDPDAAIIVRDDGLMAELPLNERATAWMREHSLAAEQGRMRRADPDYILVGDAVFIGEAGGEIVDVPERIVEHMQSLDPVEVAQSFLRRVGLIEQHYERRDAPRQRAVEQRRGGQSRGRSHGIDRGGLGR